jgi:hypothetical protein
MSAINGNGDETETGEDDQVVDVCWRCSDAGEEKAPRLNSVSIQTGAPDTEVCAPSPYISKSLPRVLALNRVLLYGRRPLRKLFSTTRALSDSIFTTPTTSRVLYSPPIISVIRNNCTI